MKPDTPTALVGVPLHGLPRLSAASFCKHGIDRRHDYAHLRSRPQLQDGAQTAGRSFRGVLSLRELAPLRVNCYLDNVAPRAGGLLPGRRRGRGTLAGLRHRRLGPGQAAGHRVIAPAVAGRAAPQLAEVAHILATTIDRLLSTSTT